MTTPPWPSQKNLPHNPPLIRASELTSYSFCHHAWWLSTVKGIRPANQGALERGTQHHQRHAGRIRTAWRWRYVGLAVLGAGSFLFVIAVVFSIL